MKKNSLMYRSFKDSAGRMLVEFDWGEIRLDGEGTCTFQEGSLYSGVYKDGRFHSMGTFTWTDGSRYEGQWKNGLPHMLGTMVLPDG